MIKPKNWGSTRNMPFFHHPGSMFRVIWRRAMCQKVPSIGGTGALEPPSPWAGTAAPPTTGVGVAGVVEAFAAAWGNICDPPATVAAGAAAPCDDIFHCAVALSCSLACHSWYSQECHGPYSFLYASASASRTAARSSIILACHLP